MKTLILLLMASALMTTDAAANECQAEATPCYSRMESRLDEGEDRGRLLSGYEACDLFFRACQVHDSRSRYVGSARQQRDCVAAAEHNHTVGLALCDETFSRATCPGTGPDRERCVRAATRNRLRCNAGRQRTLRTLTERCESL